MEFSSGSIGDNRTGETICTRRRIQEFSRQFEKVYEASQLEGFSSSSGKTTTNSQMVTLK
jgi:hypothetical protein